MNKEMIDRKRKKLLSVLAGVSNALTGIPRDDEQNGDQNQTDTDYCKQGNIYRTFLACKLMQSMTCLTHSCLETCKMVRGK